MVRITDLKKKKLTKQDKAANLVKQGKTTVDWQTTGPNPPRDFYKDPIRKTENIARTDEENPDFRDFYLNADTFTAPGPDGVSQAQISQQKFNELNQVSYGNGFPFPADNARIQNFMWHYVDGSSYQTTEFNPVTGIEEPKTVERLISFNNAVGPWSLDKFSDRNVMKQNAGDGATKINNNEVNKFPSQGVQV